MREDQLEYAKRLLRYRHAGGMGARLLSPDLRDFDLRSEPRVARQLAEGPPPSADLLRWITGPPDNQGMTPACVAASSINLCSVDEVANGGAWESGDWFGLYHQAGGDGTNGVDTRRVLDIGLNDGFPMASGRRKVIGSYAFVPQQAGVFRETIKAAIASGQPVTLALLLPAPFGWNSGSAPTTGYHQVIACGYDATWVWVFNSWGSWPGDAPQGIPIGVGRVTWDFIEGDGLQHSYAYAYATQRIAIPNPVPIPTPTPTPTPAPTPPRAATVTGRAVAGPSSGVWPVVGASLPFGTDVTLTVSQIVYDPAPTPDPTPTPIPTPTPDPSGLTVHVTPGPHKIISAYVTDAGGAYLAATCTASANGQSYGSRLTHPQAPTAIPAVWILPGMATGTRVTVTASDFMGRTATGQASLL